MITDCHTHITRPGTDQTNLAERLAAEENIDKCIVLAAPDASSSDVNEHLVQCVSKHKSRMIGFAFIDPVTGPVTEKELVASVIKKGLKGCVLYCSDCGFHPAHTRAMQFYETAQRLQLPVFFHNTSGTNSASVLDYNQPYLLDEVARQFGDLKMVIGNMGFPFVDQTLSLIAKHKNVYADLTIKPTAPWQVYTTVISAYEQSVMDKLLFGSGFPDNTASQCIEVLLGFNKLLDNMSLPTVPRGEIRKIIERDTLNLLGIQQ